LAVNCPPGVVQEVAKNRLSGLITSQKVGLMLSNAF